MATHMPTLVSLRAFEAVARHKSFRKAADEICVTHEMGFARDVSSKTVFLHQGEVCEEGAPADIFTNPETEQFRAFLSRMN